MKILKDDEVLNLYDEGELIATYLFDKTAADLAKALKACGWIDDDFLEAYEFDNIKAFAEELLDSQSFEDDDRVFYIGFGYCGSC